MKHGEESQKCNAQRSIFYECGGVLSGDETLCRIPDNLLLKQNDLEGEIKDAKLSSFLI